MHKNKKSLLATSSLLFLLLLSACKKNDFKTQKIGFIIEHPEFYVIQPVFDTITETVLIKEAYHEGATFETVSEQVLAIERHTQIKLSEIEYINVILDAEADFPCLAPCIRHFHSSEIEFNSVNHSYETRTYQKVVQDGTGTFTEAQYGERIFLRLIEDAILVEKDAETENYLIKHFTYPRDISFEEYWENQLTDAGAVGCGDASNYVFLQ